jgi:glycosyltransferase involved in cell wall biosynthesis
VAENRLVTVVIPAYNAEAYIGKALGSALGQTYEPLEIIVVDDGSSDDTSGIVRRAGSRVRLLRQENLGSGAARNRALAEARGDFVAFLDSDDVWHPRKLEFQIRHLLECRECIGVYCRKVELRQGAPEPDWSMPTFKVESASNAGDAMASGWLYLELLRDSIVHTSTLTVPRDVLSRAGSFDESLRKGQDLDYWLRLSRMGQIHQLDAVLSAYRIHASSTSHRLTGTNFHARVVERALRRYGTTDPEGRSLGRNEASRILAMSWFEFAYHHFQHDSLEVCRESVRRAIEYQPLMLRAWQLGVRARVRRMFLPRAPQRFH